MSLKNAIRVAGGDQLQVDCEQACLHGIRHHDWIDAGEEEDGRQDDDDYADGEAEALEHFLPRGSLLILRPGLAIVRLLFVVVEGVVCIIKLEPLEEIETGACDRPVDDDFHLPNEWNRLVESPCKESEEGSIL